MTAVELSERGFKVAQAVWESGGAQLTAVTSGEWNPKEEGEKIEATLQEALRALPAPTAFLIGCLPRSQVTTRHLLLPSQDPKELKGMVSLQIQRQIPFSKGRIVSDYQFLEPAPGGQSHLFLVIAEEEVVTRALTLFQRVGKMPYFVSFSSWGVLGWFTRKQPLRDGDPFLLLLDVDRWNTQAEIVRRGQLYFSRSFPIGAEALRQAEGPVSFSREVSHFLGAFKKEFPDVSLESALLGGVSDILPKATSALEGALSFPIHLFSEESSLLSEPLRETFRRSPVSYASVSGLLFARPPLPNLLPEPIKRRQRRRILQKQGSRVVILTVVLLGLLGFSLRGVLTEKQQYLAQLKQELKQLDPLVSEASSMEKDLETLRGRTEQSQQLLEFLKTLYEAIPPSSAITFLSVEPDRLSIRGICSDIPQVFSFADALAKSPELEKIEVKNTSQRRLKDRDVIDFRLDALLKPTQKGKKR